MATFRFLCGNLQLPTLRDADCGGRLVTRSLRDVLDLLDNVVSLQNFAENDVTAIKPASGASQRPSTTASTRVTYLVTTVVMKN